MDHFGIYHINALKELAYTLEKCRYVRTLKLRWTNDYLLALFLAIIYGKNRAIGVLKIYDESKNTNDLVTATVWSNIWAARTGMRFIKIFAFVCCRNPALVTSIIRNTPDTMHELYLNNCTLDLIGAQELANKIDTSTRLKLLCLQSARFNKADFLHVTKGLKHNRTIIELNLSHVRLDYNSLIPLLEALQFNKGIRKLDVSRNSFNDNAVKALVEMLHVNNTILEMNIRECGVSEWGKAYLKESTRDNVLILGINIRRPASSFFNGGGGL